MRRHLALVGCVGAIVSAVALISPVRADESALTDMLGNGIHAYNAGSYAAAYHQLTAAVDAGSRDPRVYYYRGLTNMMLGRNKSAQADFTKGSQLESTDLDHFYDVSKSLERVQGSPRLTVERFRTAARVAVVRERENLRLQRYEVLRQDAPAGESVAKPTTPAAGQPAATPMPSSDNPFGATMPTTPTTPATPADPTKPAEPAAPATPAPKPTGNPFGNPT